MNTLTMQAGQVQIQARRLFPGVLACVVVAAAATFLSERYGAPVMLVDLLSGGATATCCASTALALTAALPNHPLKELATVGIKPMPLMLGETAFLAAIVLALLHWMR